MSNHPQGWIKDPAAVDAVMKTLPYPVFQDVWQPIKGTGKGKVVLLHKIVEQVAGYFPVRYQEGPDCVSMGAATAVDIIKAVDIAINGDFEQWVSETATEDIYGGSRVQIGRGQLGGGGGSIGAWAARYVNEYGALARQKYGSIDLTKYSWPRAGNWGRSNIGVPDELLKYAKQHPVLTVSQVRTYEEARDLIANGYAITIASNQGFSSRRDSEGFARPQGSWAHQMCLVSVDDEYKRPGVLCVNSWGVWNGGPKRHDQPDGSFWIDADEVERRILSQGDSWAFSGYQGFQPQSLNTRII